MSAQPSPDDPREWIRRARSNLAQSRQRADGVYLEDLCFQAQQAAEKALKAVLMLRAQQPPRSHNIGDLLTRAALSGAQVPETLLESSILSDYAVQARYPSAAEPVDETEWGAAVRLAEAVVEWASGQLPS